MSNLLSLCEEITSQPPLHYSVADMENFLVRIAEAADSEDDVETLMWAFEVKLQIHALLDRCEQEGVEHVGDLAY